MPAATYTFLPWLRRGLSNLIEHGRSASAHSVRVVLTASLSVEAGSNEASTPPVTMTLRGPADVTAIDPRQVIRTEPQQGTADFENNYLAAIDFYDEDFPWRYSPLAADSATHRLMPWLVLVALKDNEFERSAGRNGTFLRIAPPVQRADVFPAVGQEWAWAHVHLNLPLAGTAAHPDLTQLRTALQANPDLGYSRLLCARQLEPNARYTAFLLPAFECGRKAGLGEAVADTDDGTIRSWEGAAEAFPIYYEWSFRTGAGGDFETLVRNLVPRDLDPNVGIRDMDIAHPGFGVPALSNPPDHLVGLEGALLAPTSVRRGLRAASDFVPKVSPLLNAPAEARLNGSEDPVVAPPIYGCWHARIERVDSPIADATWVNELNLDPRYRASAGLGVRVIRSRQEEYMRSAWAQIGDVLTVNRKIRRLQLALQAASASYAKSVRALDPARSMALLSPMLRKIRGPSVTLAASVQASLTPSATFSLNLVKQLRPRGRLARALLPASTRVTGIAQAVAGLSQGSLSPSPARLAAGGPTLERVNQLLLSSEATLVTSTAAHLPPIPAQITYAVNLLSREGLSATAVASQAALPQFRFTGEATEVRLPGSFRPKPARQFEPADSLAAADLRTALVDFNDQLSRHVPATPPKPALPIASLQSQILGATEPRTAFAGRFARLFRVGATDLLSYVQERYADGSGIGPNLPEVMAYPDIKEPMSQPLVEISSEYLLPNLRLIPNNTISLLKTNQAFIESYLAGLNHEFARELLWNEFPTDQQGSYFRQFWDASGFVDTQSRSPEALAEAVKDVPPLHLWERTSPLGSHDQRAGQSGGATVLVLRGELLRRYPNTFIYGQKAAWGVGAQANRLILSDPTGQLFESSPQDPRLRFPLYKAVVPPDIYLIGFDLGLEEIRGDPRLDETATARAAVGDNTGWFFVLQQAVGEPRFGLDTAPPTDPSPVIWDNLSWINLDVPAGKVIDVSKPFTTPPAGAASNGLTWGSNGADMAAIFFQEPVMIAVHGRQMLKSLALPA